MQRSVSVYGSSSALRGVQLKIGEKFKPPTKVTLPLGWKTRDPSKILSLTYDFSLEEQVIEKATAEKQAKEQEKNAQRTKELLISQHPSPVIANMGGDILMPTTVVSPGATTTKENEKQFNYKDFEGNSDSPFELVELQSINNMDALKSVLESQVQNDGPAASVPVTSSNGVQDTPATYTDTNIPNGQIATGEQPAMTPPKSPFNIAANFTTTGATTQIAQSSIVNPSASSNVPPQFNMSGQPIVYQGLNAKQDQNLYGAQNTPPSSLPVDNQMPDHTSVSNMDIAGSSQQNNSTIVDSKVPMPGAKKVLPPPPVRPPPRRPQSTGNIFPDRSSLAITEEAAAASGTGQTRPTPKPRTKFPPIKNRTNSSETPPPLPPKKTKIKQGYENIYKPVPTVLVDNHLKRGPLLPPISPPATFNSYPTVNSDSLPPSTLSPDELQFVNKLSSMGFPVARATRAVQNIGCKEREVVDFLIAVNAMCEMGHNEEHVEMVLKENNSNKEKAELFLNLLSQFKELGFSEEKIFDALKKSECDSDKTLDILTCAG